MCVTQIHIRGITIRLGTTQRIKQSQGIAFKLRFQGGGEVDLIDLAVGNRRVNLIHLLVKLRSIQGQLPGTECPISWGQGRVQASKNGGLIHSKACQGFRSAMNGKCAIKRCRGFKLHMAHTPSSCLGMLVGLVEHLGHLAGAIRQQNLIGRAKASVQRRSPWRGGCEIDAGGDGMWGRHANTETGQSDETGRRSLPFAARTANAISVRSRHTNDTLTTCCSHRIPLRSLETPIINQGKK